MKIKYLFYFVALASTLLSSCTNDDDHDGKDTKRAVSFSTVIASTRASGTAWSEGDKVGVFMVPQGGTLDAALASNKKYSASTTGELTYDTEDQAIYFPSDGSKVVFTAYYPYTATTTNNKIDVDLKDQTSQEAIDLLYAPTTASEYSNASDKVSLNFKHQLTRVVFNITKASDVDLSNFAVKLQGFETKGTFDLATGTLTTTSGNIATVACKLAYKGNNQLQVEAIVLPTTQLGNDASVEFTIGSQTFKQSLTGSILNSGSNYTYTVNISNSNGNPVVVVGQAIITDWITVAGDNINIDLGTGTTDPDPTTGTEQTIFTETFGSVEKKSNGYWPAINEFTGWDNSSFTFTDNYLTSSYSNATIRSTSTMDSHVWFASGKDAGLQISGFNTTGYTNLKLSYAITANAAGNQSVIKVKCGNTEISVPDLAISAVNTYQTVELSSLPENITSIEFISSASTNTAGYRVDDVKLVGVK